MSKTNARWRIEISRQAEKVLAKLPEDLQRRIDSKIMALAENPWPPGCKKLSGKGHDNFYRIRVGDWRVSYAVEQDVLIILILEVASRGEAYRDL